MAKTAGVVIVGGGVLGASVAYHLAGRGLRDVLVLERTGIAHAASSRAAGLILQLSSKPAVDRLSRMTAGALAALEDQLGEALDFHRVGTVRVAATDSGRAALDALHLRARREGIAAERVDAQWLTGRLPWLAPEAGAECLHIPGEGFIDAYRLTAAYARAARRRGARIETGAAVHAVRIEGGRVAGVETSGGKRLCEKVVLAAGAWSNNLTMPLGVRLPMVPTRSHFWVTAPDPMFAGDQPMTVHVDAGAYTRPEVGGLLIGLQETRSRTFDCRLLPDDIAALRVTAEGEEWDELIAAQHRLARFFPDLEKVRFESYVAGLSAYTPDGHFLLGEIGAAPGLFVAAGCCGSGVMASAGIGDALAGLIAAGRSDHDLSPFDPARFGEVDPASPEFQARCAAARASKAQ